MKCVLQNWVMELPLLAQSVLLSVMRGPDAPYAPKVKELTRWMRGLVQLPADPGNVVEYMQREIPDRMFEHTVSHKQMEAMPLHFCNHILLALEVIAHSHYDSAVKMHAYELYTDMCHIMNVIPHSKHVFDRIYEDREWPGGKQPTTPEEAFFLVRDHGSFSEHDQRLIKEEEVSK